MVIHSAEASELQTVQRKCISMLLRGPSYPDTWSSVKHFNIKTVVCSERRNEKRAGEVPLLTLCCGNPDQIRMFVGLYSFFLFVCFL